MLSIFDPFLFHLLLLKIINFPSYSFEEVSLMLYFLLNRMQKIVVVLRHVYLMICLKVIGRREGGSG